LIENQIVHLSALLLARVRFWISDYAPAADAIPSTNLSIQVQDQQGALKFRTGQLRMADGVQIVLAHKVRHHHG